MSAEKITEVLDALMATHCGHCLRPMASEADWENTEEGERPDLCWEDSGNCRIGSEQTHAEFYAEALTPLLAAEHERALLTIQEGLELHGHLPIGVTADGQGPTEPDEPHHRVCWCGLPECPWTLALAAEREAGRAEVREALACPHGPRHYYSIDGTCQRCEMPSWVEALTHTALRDLP